MQSEDMIERIEAKYRLLAPYMDERMRRNWVAAEVQTCGWGGLRSVSRALGMSPNTIRKGLGELAVRAKNPDAPVDPRLRQPGGGRKRQTEVDPELTDRLEGLVEPGSRGDPESLLRWTCKSTTRLAQELGRLGHPASPRTVGRLLNAAGYSLQSNRKTKEGAAHPDRNAQFEHIQKMARSFQQRGEPVISIDTKKKELVGAFKNVGREWRPKGEPEAVQVHDFLDPQLGKAIPYGVYDVSANQGWVSVGIDHDTARFAAEAVHRWWKKMGAKRYRQTRELLIIADGGGSNGSRSRLWKVALQELANRFGFPIRVCHFPPGTSKWNKIEHRMFSHITQNWRGRPLVSHEVIVQLIGNTSSTAGLKIRAELDSGLYPTGLKVTDAQLDALNLKRADFHGDWNYTLLPMRNNK